MEVDVDGHAGKRCGVARSHTGAPTRTYARDETGPTDSLGTNKADNPRLSRGR